MDVVENNLRHYVAGLREELEIKCSKKQREYQVVPENVLGEQAQLDYGESYLRVEGTGERIKVHFMTVILFYSRFKYVEFSEAKFDAIKTTVEALERCFEYLGRMPSEPVIDQDDL